MMGEEFTEDASMDYRLSHMKAIVELRTKSEHLQVHADNADATSKTLMRRVADSHLLSAFIAIEEAAVDFHRQGLVTDVGALRKNKAVRYGVCLKRVGEALQVGKSDKLSEEGQEVPIEVGHCATPAFLYAALEVDGILTELGGALVDAIGQLDLEKEVLSAIARSRREAVAAAEQSVICGFPVHKPGRRACSVDCALQ